MMGRGGAPVTGRLLYVVLPTLLFLVACPSPLPDFSSPYDPDNPDSPFSARPASTTISSSDAGDGVAVRVSWDPIPEAELYHLQIASGSDFGADELVVESDQLSQP